MRDCEVALRSQLVEDLGLKVSERIEPLQSSEQNDEYECDVCHSILYISMVTNKNINYDFLKCIKLVMQQMLVGALMVLSYCNLAQH